MTAPGATEPPATGPPATGPPATGPAGQPDPLEPLTRLFRDLRTTPEGLSEREAARRLEVSGPNELARRGGRQWPGELAAQFTQPLAILLAVAAVLALVTGTPRLTIAIAAVIVLNAAFSFTQELQAEQAVEALAAFLPERARVLREGERREVEARLLVPGDVLLVEEGERVCADARLISGTVDVDMSTLTGESMPVTRSAGMTDPRVPRLQAPGLVFSGTECTAGEAKAVVTATGMGTELGRIAALSQRVGHEESPLERQVRRVARLIAFVAVGAGIAFLPIGLAAGLSLAAAASFAIGLLVANVPEGLLPTITLALAVGVRELARRGALVKRLSAVETLGSTSVICTDKTGTLTENRMRVTTVWPRGGGAEVLLAEVAARCNTSALGTSRADSLPSGDPTELALLEMAASHGIDVTPAGREKARRGMFRFDPRLKLMTTVDEVAGSLVISTKGAPEEVLARVTSITLGGAERPVRGADRERVVGVMESYAKQGLRVLAFARRVLPAGAAVPASRADAERDLCLIGLVAMQDPPRPEVPDAIARVHQAGIRVHVVTGDNGVTAAAIARRVGIGTGPGGMRVVNGAAELDAMSESALDELLGSGAEVVFARSSPEAKLRIADALRATGQVVAMTGDGVNDAPALRRADIGVAMGRSGTDVAREAATMVLTDDNFATIAAAVEAGRRVYDNVRKFICYIFTHAVPEVLPFVIFALAGGMIPVPLTVLEILAIDLGTDTLPALALSREPAEPGLMKRPPRQRREGVISRGMLARSWGFLGVISATLVMAGFFLTLRYAGWHPGAATAAGTALNHGYRQATTVAWLGIVACQVGTAFAVRTDHASLRQVGLLTNKPLLAAIAVALAFAAAVVYAPPFEAFFGSAALTPGQLLTVAPYPFIVWGADEFRRALLRRRAGRETRSNGSFARLSESAPPPGFLTHSPEPTAPRDRIVSVVLRKVIEKTIEMICYAAAVAAFIWIAVLRNFWIALLATLCAVVGLGLLSLPFVIMRFSRESAARRRDLAALAERQGWSYCRKPDEALAARLSSFFGASPSSQYWQFAEAVTGTVNEWDFASFRYVHTFSTGQQDPVFAGGEVTHSYELWVALLPGLREPIPTIRCWPRSDPARMRFPAGHFPEGSKTGNQAFDEAFYLDGPVDLLAGGLGAQLGALIPELVASLGREFSWHLEAGTLRTNDNSLKDDPGILPALLASLAAIADLLRRHGLGTAHYDGSPGAAVS